MVGRRSKDERQEDARYLLWDREREDYIRRHMSDLPPEVADRMPHGVHPHTFAGYDRQIREQYKTALAEPAQQIKRS